MIDHTAATLHIASTAMVIGRQRFTRTGCTNTTGRNIMAVSAMTITKASQAGGRKMTM